MDVLVLISQITVLTSCQAYPHHDILRIERPVPPVLLETPDPAPLRRQEPRAGEMVGIQYPKPPQSKPSPDDGEFSAMLLYLYITQMPFISLSLVIRPLNS
jgi:hypothetical protein